LKAHLDDVIELTLRITLWFFPYIWGAPSSLL